MEIYEIAGNLPLMYALLCVTGWPIPAPEDILVMTVGWRASVGDDVGVVPALLTCYAGVLTRDASVFLCGRWFGRRLLRSRVFRRFFDEERLDQLERWIRADGRRTVFIGRFMPSIRVGAFFSCSTLGVPASTFFMTDALAAAITVPIDFALGWYFGPQAIEFADGHGWVKWVIFGVCALFVFSVVRRAKRAMEAYAEDG